MGFGFGLHLKNAQSWTSWSSSTATYNVENIFVKPFANGGKAEGKAGGKAGGKAMGKAGGKAGGKARARLRARPGPTRGFSKSRPKGAGA